ncbi:MAG: glutathione S-transferase [Pseudomonadota bacterium]
MLKLCGFAVSNYYNKVKLALMEKGLAFEEVLVWADGSPELLAKSPLGKVPFLETEEGALSESQVLMNYIEALHPAPPLVPATPFAAARVHELVTYLDVHLELVARELYAEAYFGGKVSDEIKARTKKKLAHNIAGFARLARFAPFIAGDQFTMADCAAIVHLPLVSGATKKVYGEDMLAGLPVAAYLEQMNARPTVQKVNADRKANMAAFAAAHA